MKSRIVTLLLCCLMAGAWVLFTNPMYANDATNASMENFFGERPPVKWQDVPEDAIEPGLFQVKFHPRLTNLLSKGYFESRSGEAVTLGHVDIDELNTAFGISRYQSLLHGLYEISPPSRDLESRHQQWGLHLWYEIRVDQRVDVMSVIDAFLRIPDVLVAEPVLIKQRIEPVSVTSLSGRYDEPSRMSPNDQFYGLQWGFKNTGQDIRGTLGIPGADISAEPAWEYVTGNPDVIVAVIDGGIQYNHPDLEGNIWPGIGPDGTNTKPDDHGTHVAGTVAAMSNNSIGVAGAAGGDGTPGSGVKLMSLDLFDGSHGLNTLQMNIYAADNDAAVSQNSWGYRSAGVYNQSDLDGIDYFNANGGGNVLDGGLTIFAAGNNNNNGQWYPAYYSGAMAVASTDNRDRKSSFSNFGSWIDLSAPGTDIASTGSGSSYIWMSGTSMACPHVSGIAALVLSYAPGVMSNQDLWDLLVATTDNIDSENPNHVGLLGSGRLNALQAVEAAQAFLGGVQRPSSLTATATGESDINVAWQANNDNDAVLIAFSENGNFGTPSDGTTYSAGQTISGGGTVLYFGQSQNALTHTGLDFASTYYYRAWSYSGSEYSGHIAAQATTFPPDNFPLPFTENFNDFAGIPLGWSTGGTASWTVGTFSNGLTGTTGNYAYAEFSGNTARTAHLISPSLVLTEFTDIRLEFKHRYNHERSSAILAYSLNDGGSWTTIQSWSSNTGTTSFNQVIGALAGQPNVKFRWTLTFEGGGPPSRARSWSIDDVSVTGTSAGTMYTITATAGTGGSINPAGSITVSEGANQSFSINPNNGFEIADVVVNGSSVGPVTAYTFNNVSADHTIHATFEEIPVITYSIQASAGNGGSISPSGAITVVEGDNQSFSIVANSGFEIADVVVDGSSVGPVTAYTFNNVSANHTIHATFAEVQVITYTIQASAGNGGSINPSGSITVVEGDNQAFSISPNSGFVIADVVVDGGSVGAVTAYTFNNVTADHTIHATFETAPEDPCLITTLPYSQDFNAAAAIPECWESVINTGDVAWQVGSFSGGLNGTTGNYAYFFYQGNQARNADLISQPFDFSNYTGINLAFTHYHVASRSSVGLYYSTDGGNNWTTIQTWSNSTGNPASFSQNLSGLAGVPNVIFRWNMNYGGGGPPQNSRSWSVDDIVVTGTIAQGGDEASQPLYGDTELLESEVLEMTCFPNPATDQVNISFNRDVTNGTIIFTDISGRDIYTLTVNDLHKQETVSVNTGNWTKGLFVVRLITNEGTTTQIITVK
ncbi:MAG: T9SS C-terminal target domain-containing protein [Bacteroidia bacterium]|nr:MAG: T9SS C-terminal target domain-containing protein [Bacteroidia bacterium]